MKKLLVIGVAVLCLAMAAPAMAKVTMGGMITTDVMYDTRDEDFVNPTQKGQLNDDDGQDRFIIGFPRAHNRLTASYKSDDGTVSGQLQIRAGGYGSKQNNFEMYYGWMDYRLNDMVHFRIGRQFETFAHYVPGAAAMGHTEYTIFVGYGNLHSSNGDAVKAYVKFNDNIRMEFAIQDPDNDGAEAPAAFPAKANTGGVNESSVIPRFDLALPITIGNFRIEPSATYLKQDYNNVAAGYDDSVDIWGVSLGAKAGFGPVTLSLEATYGQNLGNGNYTGAGHAGLPAAIAARSRAYDSTGNGIANVVSDSDIFCGWFELDFNFGPATLQMAIGMEDVTNDMGPGSGDDYDTTRFGYAVSLPIKVAKGFTVTPTVVYHDRDSGAKTGIQDVNGVAIETDYGSEMLVGVQFMLKF